MNSRPCSTLFREGALEYIKIPFHDSSSIRKVQAIHASCSERHPSKKQPKSSTDIRAHARPTYYYRLLNMIVKILCRIPCQIKKRLHHIYHLLTFNYGAE